MTAEILTFPRARLTPAEELANRWDAAAGAALRRFAWMWPDDVPHWVCASWAGYVEHWRKDNPLCVPENAPSGAPLDIRTVSSAPWRSSRTHHDRPSRP